MEDRATPIPRARSSRCSARRTPKAWTCFRSSANTSCRCTFPKRVLQEAHAVGQEVKPADRAGRMDCRGHQVVTIDPDDAKDFDDAICLQRSGAGSLEALGAHRRRLALRQAGHRAGRRGAPARQLDLPRGPRHPDAARGAEQRAVLAQAARGPADQVRRVPALRRGPGAEDAVLPGGDSLAAPLQLPRGARPAPAPAAGPDRADAARRQRARPEDPPRALQGRLARPRLPGDQDPPRRPGPRPAHREGRERHFAPAHRGVHAAGQRGRGGAADGLEPPGDLPHPRAAGRHAAPGIPRGRAEPSHPMRQPVQPPRSADGCWRSSTSCRSGRR